MKSEDLVRTIAHELGHGAFGFEHTFDPEYGIDDRYNNLMGYGKGDAARLFKFQWDIAHNSKAGEDEFEDAEEVMMTGVSNLSKDFCNKDGVTISFLTPAATIITLPYESIADVVYFSYGATARNIQTDKFVYIDTIMTGTLSRFSLKENNEIKTYSYTHNFKNVEYKNVENPADKYIPPTIDFDKVDGFLHETPCGTDHIIHKFPKGSLPQYSQTDKEVFFFDFIKIFTPFKESFQPLLNSKGVIKQVIKITPKSNCSYCADANTITMTTPHCGKPELILVDKIAQIRVAFPDAFGKFTCVKLDGASGCDWAKPEIEIANYSTTLYVWDKYLSENEDIKALYGTDKYQFFQKFIEEFRNHLAKTQNDSEKFWKEFEDGKVTETRLVSVRTNADDILTLGKLGLETKKKALKAIFDFAASNDFAAGTSFLKMLISCSKSEQKPILEFIEKDIYISSIHERFKTNTSEILLQISIMLEGSGHSFIDENKQASFIGNITALPQLEADLFRFDNFGVKFLENNKLDIDGYGVIPYNQVISLGVAGTFTFNNVKKKKGVLLHMPAIQAVAMSKANTLKVTEKVAWLGFDGIMFVIGVWEAKVFFSAGSYIRKGIVGADLIGSLAGGFAECVNTDYISDDLRYEIQMTALLLSLPQAITSVGKAEKLIVKLDATISAKLGNANAVKELKAIRKSLLNLIEKVKGKARLSKLNEQFEIVYTNGSVAIKPNNNSLYAGIGEYKDGFIEFDIDVKYGIKDLKAEVVNDIVLEEKLAKGEDVFDAIYLKFKEIEGIGIEGVRARWVAQDNLATFNKLIIEEVNTGKITINEAAKRTFTGKMAGKHGYTKIKNIKGVLNANGTYKFVTVEFIKP